MRTVAAVGAVVLAVLQQAERGHGCTPTCESMGWITEGPNCIIPGDAGTMSEASMETADGGHSEAPGDAPDHQRAPDRMSAAASLAPMAAAQVALATLEAAAAPLACHPTRAVATRAAILSLQRPGPGACRRQQRVGVAQRRLSPHAQSGATFSHDMKTMAPYEATCLTAAQRRSQLDLDCRRSSSSQRAHSSCC
jgi:hypothetical protein